MKLYIHPASPNSVAVLALAREVGISMATEEVDLFRGANTEPEFLAINPNGLVPVLVDGDFVLWETTAILQYLAAHGGKETWLAADVRTRTDIIRWQVWGVAHWQPALQQFIFQNLFKGLKGLGDADPEAIAEATPKLKKSAKILDERLSGQPWICGDFVTVADLTLAAYLIYARGGKVPLDDFPSVSSWWSRLRRRPAWSAAESGVPAF